MKQKRNTAILFIFITILIFAGFLISKLILGKEGATAIVTQRGKIIAELKLFQNTELSVDDTIGGTNTIVVKDGAVSVTQANCPDLTCVRTGTISHTGEVIACLPHNLIITIEEGGTDSVDSTAW
ncbi:MAG: NusG domain II-containing protein [Eubacteriales bacterium]|nr:NusG domain II-containing protein [Eubacteriales bacterium]